MTYKVFELESDIGGTWLNNTYPGCQSDAPIHLYSYSFAPNYDFSKKYVSQAEILAYLKATAMTYNIYDKIQFQTRVVSMQWHEGRHKWILHWVKSNTDENGVYEADVVIHAAGVLRLPSIPKEFEAFEGHKWHSARWDHSVDLTGLRVGVVGTSARYGMNDRSLMHNTDIIHAHSPTISHCVTAVYRLCRQLLTKSRPWMSLGDRLTISRLK
jgi:cation diffusion facilitator CzcD-associated flavoprotein CzcO